MDKHFNYSTCRECGGSCCKKTPGLYHPTDFGGLITIELVKQLLDGGRVAIDWWDGRETKYYLRPRVKGEPAIYASWGGVCVNFTQEAGCALTEKERPFQCRMLIPNKVNGRFECDYDPADNAGKYEVVLAWQPFNSILKELHHSYEEGGAL